MNIVDNSKSCSRNTTLNAIPVGQVFKGVIISRTIGNRVRGLFFKANGPLSITDDDNIRIIRDVVVVRLDKVGYENSTGFSNIWLYCSNVEDYEPMDATLTLTTKKVG